MPATPYNNDPRIGIDFWKAQYRRQSSATQRRRFLTQHVNQFDTPECGGAQETRHRSYKIILPEVGAEKEHPHLCCGVIATDRIHLRN
ncbi:hypothetical protein [Falsochrobactrum shanghaiense]|uniref:hypothetical protein n=1 Tax=Falsochrobactrum shanghaiense TaxID=2201899 RepID=UPI0011B2971F|nr:hypothetical protein [Falsochrobactrum shanghaiense]